MQMAFLVLILEEFVYKFIVNPVAGCGRAKKYLKVATDFLSSRQISYDVAYTGGPGHAVELAEQAAKKHETVIAVGGDGTVSEIAKGLKHTDAVMGILPGGTGNDYRLSLNIPSDPLAAMNIILDGYQKKVDTIDFDGRTAINIVSIGFDVDVLRRSKHYRLTGHAAYTLAAIEAAFFSKYQRAKIVVDGEVYHQQFLLLALGCGTYYGGGMKALPLANTTNGLMDICFFDAIGSLKILQLLPKYMKGMHEKLPVTHMLKATEVSIELDDMALPINCDGEILPPIKKATFKIEPSSLNVIYGDRSMNQL